MSVWTEPQYLQSIFLFQFTKFIPTDRDLSVAKKTSIRKSREKISIIHEEQKWFLKRNARDQGLLVLRDQLLKNNIEAVNRQRHAYRDT